MPFELYLLWRQYPWDFGELACDAKMVTTETVTYSSILTIVAFTVERYTIHEQQRESVIVLLKIASWKSIYSTLLFTSLPSRYLAICHPLNIPRTSKMSRAVRALFFIWFTSIAFSLPWIFYNKVRKYIVMENLPGHKFDLAIEFERKRELDSFPRSGEK